MAPPVLADGASPAVKPQRAPATSGEAGNGVPVVEDPFGPSLPLGTPTESKRVQESAPFKEKSDSFEEKPAEAGGNRAGAAGKPAASPFDPFSAPTTAPTPGTATSPRPAAPKSAGPSLRRAGKLPSAASFPSLTLEESAEARQHIEAVLGTKTQLDYLGTPLKEVIEDVSFQHDMPIIISVKALEDFGIGTDTPVTINVKGVSLRSALRLMLEPMELTFLIKNEVLQITTTEDADSQLQSRFYAVAALLPPDRDGDYLVTLITKHVAPESWNEVGGPGAITFVEHLETLAITQTEDVLHQINTLLASVAKLADGARSP